MQLWFCMKKPQNVFFYLGYLLLYLIRKTSLFFLFAISKMYPNNRHNAYARKDDERPDFIKDKCRVSIGG